MVKLLQDVALFAEVGIHDAGRLPPMVSLRALVQDANHPWITNDGLAVEALLRCLLRLLKARLRSLSWSQRGYLGAFAKAWAGKAEFESLLAVMKSDWELWLHVRQMPGPILRMFVGRSSMQHMVAQKAHGLAMWPFKCSCFPVGASSRGLGLLKVLLLREAAVGRMVLLACVARRSALVIAQRASPYVVGVLG